ncbi:MAG: hypothetical protein ACLR76_00355 [Alistipes sp.]
MREEMALHVEDVLSGVSGLFLDAGPHGNGPSRGGNHGARAGPSKDWIESETRRFQSLCDSTCCSGTI